MQQQQQYKQSLPYIASSHGTLNQLDSLKFIPLPLIGELYSLGCSELLKHIKLDLRFK